MRKAMLYYLQPNTTTTTKTQGATTHLACERQQTAFTSCSNGDYVTASLFTDSQAGDYACSGWDLWGPTNLVSLTYSNSVSSALGQDWKL